MNILKSIIAVTFFASLALTASAEELASGTFVGKSGHVTTGTAKIEKTDEGYVVVLAADFSLDNAPDPRVALGKDGFKKETDSGALAKLKGAQTYKLPEGVDPSDYNQVYIWCEKFSVPLGVAKLTKK